MTNAKLPAAWRLGNVRKAVLSALKVVQTIEHSTRARGDVKNQERAELARDFLEKAIAECERAECGHFPEPRPVLIERLEGPSKAVEP